MTKSKEEDWIGVKAAYWSILAISLTSYGRPAFFCKCVCGVEKLVEKQSVIKGLSKSCGCHKFDNPGRRTHGLTSTRVFKIWSGLKQRCYNKNNCDYHRYGAKGVKIHRRWRIFENFLKDVGAPPSNKHSLDRYPNPFGNYEPGNVRWATAKEQNSNRTDNVWIEHNGKRMILADWSRLLKVKGSTISRKLKTKSFAEIYLEYQNKQP